MDEMATNYQLYQDPNTREYWVGMPNGGYSQDKDAIEVAKALRSIKAKQDNLCHHSRIDFATGVPWETPDAIGRQVGSLIDMGEPAASAWHQRLFAGIHPAAEQRLDVRNAMAATPHLQWMVPHVHHSRLQGLLVKCTICNCFCRMSWNLQYSSAFHMFQQRDMICSFLQLVPMTTVLVPTPLPVV